MTLRIGVVGGSIAGCAAGAALLRAGFDVRVFERSAKAFDERGAGIRLPSPLVERLAKLDLIDEDIPCVRSHERVWSVRDGDATFGRVIGLQPIFGQQHHWGVVFRNLRRRVDDRAYVRGAQVVDLDDRDDRVVVTLVDGQREEFDLVIGADGFRSSTRRRLFPDAKPQYVGYSAWRGTLDERIVHGGPVDGTVRAVGLERGHAIFYLVPGDGGDLREGHRRINWLFYDGGAPLEVAESGRDETGEIAVDSVPPGELSPAQLRYLREVVARDRLPPWQGEVVRRTPDPYRQAVYDLPLDRYVRGRVCVIGDAATIARPHTASGATKAIEDALRLAEALQSSSEVGAALAEFEADRVRVGNELVELGRRLGHEQVVSPPVWEAFDQTSFDAWFTAGGSSLTYMFARDDT